VSGATTDKEQAMTTTTYPDTDGSTTDQAKEKAQEAAGQAKGALRSQVDQRSTDAGERVGGFASDVRSVGEQLREQGKDQPAKLADQAAQRAERLGDYLKQSDADRILGDLEDLGRRQPWAVIGGGVVLGLVASRFLKASSSRRYDQRQTGGSSLPARTSDVSASASGIPSGAVTSEPPRVAGAS
jgi:broad specificity phosphatase PhoE